MMVQDGSLDVELIADLDRAELEEFSQCVIMLITTTSCSS
jgi:hypothetical protein